MDELSLLVKVALAIFGIGGVIALSVVPWVCIGIGLFDKNKEYQSHL